ncbi:keratin, type I cytoskeletal 18-like [Entelurus aequoreus]|uniref:keratin, type I cytoskeletal 18-like n=1 Tax=Entelurus aequoreus TaxID=161455 RepID=UPI002B1D149C|nr:keratin, type I cytoskeletal 18-like [Entelurus aequoreus]
METQMRCNVAKFMEPRGLYKSYSHSVSGEAGGEGTKISVSSRGRVSNMYDYRNNYALEDFGGLLAIGNEKLAMKHLNDRLASYMETVRSLEKANSSLEIKIRETIERRGPMEGSDYSKYNAAVGDLRAKIFAMIKGNTRLAINLDNAKQAADDFRIKMHYELAMRQTVESDTARLRKILDDTNLGRMYCESEFETLNAELITLRKTHKAEVDEMRVKITQAGVFVDVDAPKGQDLARIMDEMREKYEKIMVKNKQEAKEWHESQMTEVKVKVTESTTALKEATTVVSVTKKKFQTLDIELQSQLSLIECLKANLRDMQMRSSMEMEKYNVILVSLQEQLANLRNDIFEDARQYQVLLDIKVKLEAEIMEYRRLLGGEIEVVDKKKVIQTQVVTVTQTLVDGKVVSESRDVQSNQEELTA